MDCFRWWPGRDNGGNRIDASLLLLGPEGEDNRFEVGGIEVEKERFTSLDGISASPLQKYKERISKSVSNRGKNKKLRRFRSSSRKTPGTRPR